MHPFSASGSASGSTRHFRTGIVGAGRAARLGYAASGSVDDALGRITTISSAGVDAGYAYAGVSRRVSSYLGPAPGIITQTFAGSGGYAGLDRFGRVKDLHYAAGTATVHRYQYGYDAAGNRLFARVMQAATQDAGGNSVPHDNDRSYLYNYDELNRLYTSAFGALDANNAAMLSGSGDPPPLTSAWTLDNLGNWSGSDGPPQVAGLVRTQDLNADGDTIDPGETLTLNHVVNNANEIESSVANGSATSTFVYDRNGNLVFDDNYWYQYDAWNRLVQVHDGSSLSSTDFGAGGMLLDPNAAAPREWVARYIYDAFGRLIRKRMPHPGDATVKVTENYSYDGVRRIQTRVKRPLVQAPAPIPAGEQSGYIGFAGQASDAYVEHVYGPGYVDEFVATVAEDGATQYILQDANYNVTALISGGPPPGGSAPPAGTVLEQYQYSPYGELIVRDQLASKPTFNPIGHQGLFHQRHDAGPHLPPLDVAAVGLYYNRARFYSPSLGRFVQKDMNETALPIATALAMNGGALDVLFGAFAAQSHYGDGMNLYAYAGSNPVIQRDPSGRFVASALVIVGSVLMGGVVGGTANALFGDGSFLAGFVGGAVGTAAGLGMGAAVLPFASAYGLWGTLAGGAIVGATEGFFQGAGQAFYNTGDFSEALATGAWSGAVGGVVGPAVAWGGGALVRWGKARLAGSAASELAGQLHHAISARIWQALERNAATAGVYKPRDARFISQAVDEAAHRGYQAWHRKLDDEVGNWIETNVPSPDEFERYLRALYNSPELRARFPNGLD